MYLWHEMRRKEMKGYSFSFCRKEEGLLIYNLEGFANFVIHYTCGITVKVKVKATVKRKKGN